MKQVRILITIFFFSILIMSETISQVVIRDSIRITHIPIGDVKPTLSKSSVMMGDGVVSGFIIPRDGNLQVYYVYSTRLDYPMMPCASLIMMFESGDSVVTDFLHPRFPEIMTAPLTFYNACFRRFETHIRYFYQNYNAPEEVYLHKVGKVEEGDTVLFLYDTQNFFTFDRDTLPVWESYEIRLEDGTLVGWRVMFDAAKVV